MILRYKKRDGTQVEFELGDRAITIGRSSDADLVILDHKASRVHCGIRIWDGDFFIKDLRSKNGTFVNGAPIDMVKLAPGDKIRVGACVFTFESEPGKGTDTILREIEDEMDQGKGYATILKEVVEESRETPPPPASEPPRANAGPPGPSSPGKFRLKTVAPKLEARGNLQIRIGKPGSKKPGASS